MEAEAAEKNEQYSVSDESDTVQMTAAKQHSEKRQSIQKIETRVQYLCCSRHGNVRKRCKLLDIVHHNCGKENHIAKVCRVPEN